MFVVAMCEQGERVCRLSRKAIGALLCIAVIILCAGLMLQKSVCAPLQSLTLDWSRLRGAARLCKFQSGVLGLRGLVVVVE